MVNVEILYIPVDQSECRVELNLPAGATVYDALEKSSIWQIYPETKDMAVGIFSRLTPLHTVLKKGDRVEIYRPLTVDPKEKRRQRVKK